ncbi:MULTISPECIES: response regulator [unclassified Virgibacillus]|uniref:response regulator transcription factor n=1 Tax=unclassified Virgibacillus TaxID=2620237 RepID=UPI0024DE324C|nr:response regulator [Virgibacillus sp. LDC-1]
MRKVLLVEDEKVIRDGVKTLLEEVITGYSVLWEADCGKRALDIVNIEIPDLIITDIRMPNVDGLEFIGILKNIHPSVPVIIISGYDDFAYVRKALKLGVKDYLLKPINRMELASVLETINKSKQVLVVSEDNIGEPTIIKNIKEAVEENLEGNLSLNYLSKTLNLHPNYISQQFSQHTEIRLSDYILDRRMSKAKELLLNTNLKVYDIAHLTGFSNAKHFASVFKKHNEKTPQQYREES